MSRDIRHIATARAADKTARCLTGDIMRTFILAVSMLTTAAPLMAAEPINYGTLAPNPVKPFTATAIATFEFPWKLAFLPDGRMLVTEKTGQLRLVGADGKKILVG